MAEASNFFGHAAAHTIGDAFKPVLEGVKYVSNTVAPILQPDVGELFHATIRGWISEDVLPALCRIQGVTIDPGSEKAGTLGNGVADNMARTWNRIYWSHQELPGQAEYREIANRQLWPDSRVAAGLVPYGYYTEDVRQLVSNLRYDIPGPADLVRFSVRHFWEPDILAKFGYNSEFPGAIIDLWHAMKGLDYPLFTGPFESQIDKIYGVEGKAKELANDYAEAGIGEPTWARAYWFSHWVLPSPTQGYLMWQRLNPDRDVRWDAPEMVGQNFSFQDLSLLLRANDYPPYFRPLLAAISHPIPGIRFMRDFVRNGVYEYKDIVEWGRRQGYAPLDAKNIADDVWQAEKVAKQAKADAKCLALIKQAFAAGLLSYQDLITQIASCGVVAGDVPSIADAIVLGRQIQRAKQTVASVRSRYLKGRLSDDQVLALLRDAGIQGDRAQEDLTDWQLERDSTGREATIAQALKWACDGFISLDDFQTRAENLGYSTSDITPLLAQVRQCQATLLARALAAEAKAERQLLKDQQAVIKQAAQAVRQAQRDLAAHGSPGKLREWYCQGFLTEADLFTRLRFLGWPDGDITRLVGDCKGVRDAKLPGLLTPPGG